MTEVWQWFSKDISFCHIVSDLFLMKGWTYHTYRYYKRLKKKKQNLTRNQTPGVLDGDRANSICLALKISIIFDPYSFRMNTH